MNHSERLKILMESGRTVFTPLDLRMLWRVNALNAKISVVRMAEKGLMVRLATGYYALKDRYNRYELANRILSPSYVSFQSALFYAGINFQARGEIGSVALRGKRKRVGNTLYTLCSDEMGSIFQYRRGNHSGRYSDGITRARDPGQFLLRVSSGY